MFSRISMISGTMASEGLETSKHQDFMEHISNSHVFHGFISGTMASEGLEASKHQEFMEHITNSNVFHGCCYKIHGKHWQNKCCPKLAWFLELWPEGCESPTHQNSWKTLVLPMCSNHGNSGFTDVVHGLGHLFSKSWLFYSNALEAHAAETL